MKDYEKLQKLVEKREININKYIIPIEIKISDLREKLFNCDKCERYFLQNLKINKLVYRCCPFCSEELPKI